MSKIADTIAKKETHPMTTLFVNSRLFVSKTTMLSAMKLFKKCANIATTILSVLIYRIAMQIEKTNAEVIFPKVCNAAKRRDIINIEKSGGTIMFNLFIKIPLKNSSSKTGDMKTVATKLEITIEYVKSIEDMLK